LITEQLDAANKARADADGVLKEAEAKLNDARVTAQTVLDGAAKSGEQLKQELRQRAEEEAQRVTAAARKEIEVERERAIQSARAEVADLVVSATEKVLGETLDGPEHQELIERAIAEVASGDGRS
jgi:F-type H+-transporting ATPase subunit b